jgi:DNA ligase-1
LIVPKGTFQETSSAVMSRSGEPKFQYQVFDWVAETTLEPYNKRIDRMIEYQQEEDRGVDHPVRLVLPVPAYTRNYLEMYEQYCLVDGYEGVMVRQPDSPYKNGRSTEREGWLLKIKRFQDSDAVVIGYEEKMHNANELTRDELGRAKRTSHKENKVPMDTLGALRVKDVITGVEFNIGTGFTDQMRAELWAIRTQLIGKMVKYKSQPSGVKDAPRFPVFLGVRSSLP